MQKLTREQEAAFEEALALSPGVTRTFSEELAILEEWWGPLDDAIVLTDVVGWPTADAEWKGEES